MTAANSFIGSDAAYLLTDTAVIADDNRIIDFTPKVVSCGRLRTAACMSGERTYNRLEDGTVMAPLGNVEDVFERCATQADLLDALPDAFCAAYRAAAAWMERPMTFRILTAIWWEQTQEPRVYYSCSPEYVLPGMGPFALNRLGNFMITPDVPIDPDPDRFRDSKDEAREVINAQRRKPWPDGGFKIGGSAELTTVDAAGVRTETICRWPDRIGRKVRAR